MAIFSPRANLFMNIALLAAAGGVAFLLILIWVVPVMGYNTQEHYIPPQPVPFSHKHHVSGLGLDCRYCHTTVEVSQNAGMPPTHTCMTCHSQIWTNAELLAPVRRSLAEDKPLRWTEALGMGRSTRGRVLSQRCMSAATGSCTRIRIVKQDGTVALTYTPLRMVKCREIGI